jgi:hypothetical protein
MCVPVLKRLTAPDLGLPDVRSRVMALTTARSHFDREGIPSFGYREYCHLEPGHSEYGEKLAQALSPNASVDAAETEAYLGVNFANMVRDYGLLEARRIYSDSGRQAFYPVNFMANVLRAESPDLVVSTNSPRSERAVISAARQLGIPSICLVDLFAIHESKWIAVPGFADRVCVLSSAVKARFLAAGRADTEVIVTGNPAFDRLAQRATPEEILAWRVTRGWCGKPMVLWVSQPEPKSHPFSEKLGDPLLPARVDEAMAEFARRNPAACVAVRLHPSETRRVQEFRLPNFIVSSRDDDLTMSLQAADVVLVTSSTVGMEAILMGRPVVAYSGSVFSADAPYAAMGLATGVDTIGEISTALFKAIELGPASLDSVFQPGTATASVVDQIRQLLPS